MPEELNDEEVDVEELESEEPAGSEEDNAKTSSEGSDDDDGGEQEEYFLAVNDRQRYRTKEDVVKAMDEAGNRIASYSRFGTPEEIAELQQKAELVERMFGKGAVSDDPGDPLSDLTPQQRKEWDSFMSRFEKVAEQKGYVRQDKINDIIADQVARTTQENRAKDLFQEQVKDRGFDVTPARMDMVTEAAVALARNDNSVREMWNKGDVSGFVSSVIENLYGPSTPKSSKSKEPERGEDGKFKKRAEYDETKDKTKKLPKSPPKGSGAAATGGEELSLEDRIDPAKRKKRAAAILEERLSA